jgi:hypothetical protein
MILGDPSASPPVLPTDNLMVESVAPRMGMHPLITGGAIQPPTAAQGANVINGHEWYPPRDTDLQYACIFPLAMPRDCVKECTDTATMMPCSCGSSATCTAQGACKPAGGGNACDCCDFTYSDISTCQDAMMMPCTCGSGGTCGPKPVTLTLNNDIKNPLCQAPGSTTTDAKKRFAKAYPGIRILQVLQGLGSQAVVGSICPAQLSDPSALDYGYRPMVPPLMAKLAKIVM